MPFGSSLGQWRRNGFGRRAGSRRFGSGRFARNTPYKHLPVLKGRTQAVYRGHIAAVRTDFEDRYIDEMRKGDVAAFVAKQKRRGLKSPTIRRYLGTLSSMFTFAVRVGWLQQNLMATFDKRSVPKSQPRTRFLSQEAFGRLVDAAEPHLRPLVNFAVNTGMRLEELLSLRWFQVDLDRQEFG